MTLSDFEKHKKDLLDILYQSDVKLTAQTYIKKIKQEFSIPVFEARKLLQRLIAEQELSYNYLYGSTYIEKNFLKPVQVTKHFTLKPPGFKGGSISGRPDRKPIELIIDPGISFGSGQHPTTQLCMEAIDFCFFEKPMVSLHQNSTGADIGTGSGVLAMAMCLSGLSSCKAYEIDPVSINEAKKNISLNLLSNQIQVLDKTMEEGKKQFSIICANLRFPTLKALSDMIFASLTQGGIAIFSGVREWEKENLITIYTRKGFDLAWQKDEKNWSGFVLKKKLC